MVLVESSYRGEISRLGWTTEADLLGGQRTDADEVTSILAEPAARLLLAIEHHEIVGCVLSRHEPGGVYIGMLAVRPQLQAKGLGKRLLADVALFVLPLGVGPNADVGGEAGNAVAGQLLVAEGDDGAHGWWRLALLVREARAHREACTVLEDHRECAQAPLVSAGPG